MKADGSEIPEKFTTEFCCHKLSYEFLNHQEFKKNSSEFHMLTEIKFCCLWKQMAAEFLKNSYQHSDQKRRWLHLMALGRELKVNNPASIPSLAFQSRSWSKVGLSPIIPSFSSSSRFNFWNGILLPKLFWPTVRKNCSSDREKYLKFEAEGQEFSNILRSLEQFIQTVKGQNNFW